MSQNTDWTRILGNAADGALSAWLDDPMDGSISATPGAATAGGDSLPERRAVSQSGQQANSGNTGWAIPQGNNLLLVGGIAIAGVLAFAAVMAD